MSRSKKGLLHKTKRGVTSLFVCVVVLLPVISVGWWFKYLHSGGERKATPLPAFAQRKVDSNSPPKLFQEPLISVTFDDGWESIYTVAAPLLQKNGIHSTQYLISSTTPDPGYMSAKQIKALRDSGDEIACHSVTHPDLTTLPDDKLAYELNDCKSNLQRQYGITPLSFASPYGHFNDHTIAAIKKSYTSHRDTNGDISNGIDEFDVNIKDKFNQYDIIAVTVRRDTPIWQLRQAVDYTIAHKGWLVLNYHQIDEGPSKFGLDPAVMSEQLSYLSSTPVRIVTVGQVISAMPRQ